MSDHEPDTAPTPTRPFLQRRWWKILLGLGVVAVAMVAALPWFLGTPPARRWLLQKANEALGPGELTIDQIRFSWFRPTHLDGFTIRDEHGGVLVKAPKAVWDRNLYQAILRRPKLGTLRLEGAVVDVERRGDGSIDLVDFLGPILKGQPETDLAVEVAKGSIRLRSPELAAPVVATRFHGLFRRPAAPRKVSWVASLDEGDRTLRIDGDFDRWDDKPAGQNGLRLDLVTSRWPLAVTNGDLIVSAEVSRAIKLVRTDGLWSVDSSLDLNHVAASGPLLGEDRPTIDSLIAHFAVEQRPTGWSVRSLDVRSKVATLRATGPIPADPGESHRVVGQIDLAAIAAMLPHRLSLKDDLTLDRGTAEVSLLAESGDKTRRWTAAASLSELAGHVGTTEVSLREPMTITLRASDRDDSFAVEGLSIQSAFLNAEGAGNLDTGVSVDGTLDLAALVRQAEDFVDLKRAGLVGSGPISVRFQRTNGGQGFAAHLGVDFETASAGPENDPIALEGLRFAIDSQGDTVASWREWTTEANLGVTSARRDGLDLGPTQIQGRFAQGKLALEPIETTLNGGTMRLVPEVDLESSPAIVRLLPGTELADAEVNERATQRVLAFVAPILEGATRASGKVSARIDRAEIPIEVNTLDDVVVEGNVVFKDVVFSPGPVARELLGLINRSDSTLTINQPVVLSISNGVVHQTGFSVPVGDVTTVSIEGSVGFDKTLDLVASMPITDAMFPNRPLVGDLIGGTRVTVPIGGTLDKPKIDQDAFREAMKDMGKDLAIRSATQGAARLLFRLAQPRDPNAPKPLTAAERKAKRLEKKLERKSRGSEPN